jgi:hypothetical protein
LSLGEGPPLLKLKRDRCGDAYGAMSMCKPTNNSSTSMFLQIQTRERFFGARPNDYLRVGGVQHPFLQAFSRPVRDVSCECAREEDPSLPQMLPLLNNKGVLNKVASPGNRFTTTLPKGPKGMATSDLVERLYLATLSRRPTAAEAAIAVRHVDDAPDAAKGLQDAMCLIQHK